MNVKKEVEGQMSKVDEKKLKVRGSDRMIRRPAEIRMCRRCGREHVFLDAGDAGGFFHPQTSLRVPPVEGLCRRCREKARRG